MQIKNHSTSARYLKRSSNTWFRHGDIIQSKHHFFPQLCHTSKSKANLMSFCYYYQLRSQRAILVSPKRHCPQVTSFSSSFHLHFEWRPSTWQGEMLPQVQQYPQGRDLGRSGHPNNTLEVDLADHNSLFPDSPEVAGQFSSEILRIFKV